MIVGNYNSYTKSDFYEIVNVITNFLGQPLSVKCDFWVGLAWLWNGLNKVWTVLIFNFWVINMINNLEVISSSSDLYLQKQPPEVLCRKRCS